MGAVVWSGGAPQLVAAANAWKQCSSLLSPTSICFGGSTKAEMRKKMQKIPIYFLAQNTFFLVYLGNSM